MQGESGEGDELSAQEIENLQQQCANYCGDPSPNAVLSIGTSLYEAHVMVET